MPNRRPVGNVVVVYVKTVCDFFSPVWDIVRILHCKVKVASWKKVYECFASRLS